MHTPSFGKGPSIHSSWKGNRSFFFHFFILAFILTSFLVGSLLAFSLYAFRVNFVNNVEVQSRATVEAVRGLVRQYIDESVDRLNGAARFFDRNLTEDQGEIEQFLEFAYSSDQFARYYQSIGDDGLIEYMYPERAEFVGTDASGHTYFQVGLSAGEARWFPAILSDQANEPVAIVTVPYFKGLLVAQISLLPMLESIEEIPSATKSQIGVIDQRGVYLLHSSPSNVSRRVISPFAEYIQGNTERSSGLADINGVDYFYVAAPLEVLGGHILLYQSYPEIMKDYRRIIVWQVSIAVLFLILALGISIIAGRMLIQPIQRTVSGINSLASGDYAFRLPELPFQELNTIAFSINQMATSIQRRQNELASARDEAERANAVKDRFIANMSHELRTPLNGISGMASLLGRSVTGQEQQKQVRIIHSSIAMISQIVSDILEYAAIEQQKLRLNPVCFSLREFIESLSQTIMPLSKQKGLEFSVEYDLKNDLQLYGDKVRASQILLNLLTNAVKYSDEGTIRFVIDIIAQDNINCRLEMSVIDTGIGIAPADQELIFTRFTQLDDSTTKRERGIGIGLSITRELVRLMDGSLELDSHPGKGSRFTVNLPFRIAEDRESSPETSVQFDATQFRILVAEDEAINRLYIKTFLLGLGFQVVEAKNGREAVDRARDESPDLLLMDISMPVMDGWQAVDEIRKSPRLKDLPIIALTAHTQTEIKTRCQELGMRSVVEKPIQEELLQAKIREALS